MKTGKHTKRDKLYENQNQNFCLRNYLEILIKIKFNFNEI